jgi:endoglucanase
MQFITPNDSCTKSAKHQMLAKPNLVVLLLALLPYITLLAAEPVFVDLKQYVNTAREDDGTADNGKGGWTDEGINDMFIYPPIPTGRVARNGYQFTLVDPKQADGNAVIMLRGSKRAKDKPESVTIPLKEAKARYLYFLQHSAAAVPQTPKEYALATYTLTYADGSTAELPVRDWIEIRPWWARNWYDNSGKASWPIFVGVNAYCTKWRFHVSLFACQWQNPQPDKPMKSITLKSACMAVPIIWAITLADEDFYEPEARRKTEFKRPEDVPEGYFNAKLKEERAGIYAEAVKLGYLKGVRGVEVIRGDLLAVSVDDAMGRIGSGSGAGEIEAFQKPEAFAITSASDPNYREAVRPVRVGRQTRECWNGDIGLFPHNTLYLHTFYLALPKPLDEAHTYRVTVANGLDESLTRDATLAADPAGFRSPAIKVNQVAYSSRARRYAYLGWWAGDLGAVDFAACREFGVFDEAEKKEVLKGNMAPRRANDTFSGENVLEMDLSALKPGRYHIRVVGLGRSDSFAVGGGLRELYVDSMRVFFHQRCGQELKEPWTTFKRPACHMKSYAGGYLVGNPDYKPKPNEEVREFIGGYHDAADNDCFTYHLRATAQTLVVFERFPKLFKDGDLNLPESGNKIPDLLDEARWALFFYRDHQLPDGAVPLGRGNDEDYLRDYERAHKSRPPFGILPPSNTTATEFAAVAAQFARLYAPYDKADADTFLAAARKAFAWAQKNPTKPQPEKGEELMLAWAAAELFCTTGEESYNEAVCKAFAAGHFSKYHWQFDWVAPVMWWPYAATTRENADPAVRKALREMIVKRADGKVEGTEKPAYRMGEGERGGGWGSLGGGGRQAWPCIMAHMLTGEQKYLDAAGLNADFQLGANPLSKTFITGTGVRFPGAPQINPALYHGPNKTGETLKGITVYGLAAAKPEPQKLPGWYPEQTPPWRSWRDIGWGGAEVCSEFTITETIGNTAALYAYLYAMENERRD